MCVCVYRAGAGRKKNATLLSQVGWHQPFSDKFLFTIDYYNIWHYN